jgi:uncharacterized membrane protein YfcA
MADKAAEQKMLIARNTSLDKSRNFAAQRDNTAGGNYIRRTIALIAIIGGLGIVFLAPLSSQVTNVPIQVTEGWKFLIFDFTNTVTKYVPLQGYVTPEWLPVAIMNIIGFYFGSGAMKR